MPRVFGAALGGLGAVLVLVGLSVGFADSGDDTLFLSLWWGGVFVVPGLLLLGAAACLWRRR